MLYFFDSSALVKYYVEEIGSDWIQSVIENTPQTKLWISDITGPEVLSAFTRRYRNKELQQQDYDSVIQKFQEDYEHSFMRIRVTTEIVDAGMKLIPSHFLRAYDSVQLSTALMLNTHSRQELQEMVLFLSADQRLLEAAEKEGLNVRNPNINN